MEASHDLAAGDPAADLVNVGPAGAAARAVSFGDMEGEAPELAVEARHRFGSTGLCLLASLRADGWPRISPVEPLVVDGHVYLGMMPGSLKARDLGRDPRCLVHSTVNDRNGTEGEVKLYGVARRVLDGDEFERYAEALAAEVGWRPVGTGELDVWAVDLVSGAYQRFGVTDGTQVVDRWRPGHGLDSTTRLPTI